MKRIMAYALMACLGAAALAQAPQTTQPQAPLLTSIDQIKSEAAQLLEKNAQLEAAALKAEAYKTELQKKINNMVMFALMSPYNKAAVENVQKSFATLDKDDFADFLNEKAALIEAVNDYGPMMQQFTEFLIDMDSQEKDPNYYAEFTDTYLPKIASLDYYKKYKGKKVYIPYLQKLFDLTEEKIKRTSIRNKEDYSEIILLAKGLEIKL